MQTSTPAYYALRAALFTRDGMVCQYCGTTAAKQYIMEHVVPERRGGVSELYNLVVACDGCNKSKGNEVWIPRDWDTVAADAPEWHAWVLANADPPRPETVKFTVHGADPELIKQIRHLAVDTGRTIGDLSNEGWRYVLAQHGNNGA